MADYNGNYRYEEESEDHQGKRDSNRMKSIIEVCLLNE